MKKILLLVCLLCLLLAGCGPQEKNTADSGKVLYTVTDATGTKLSFSERLKLQLENIKSGAKA